MQYNETVKGTFIERRNRFIAEVQIGEGIETVHVKNTGRLKELLQPKAEVILEVAQNPNRKTKYSLIAVKKETRWINIDSQVPNAVVFEACKAGKIQELDKPTLLKREVTYGNSRFDMYFENGDKKGFIEVKGVTLEHNGIAMFPDAPTKRGTKHMLEMIQAVKEGWTGIIFFLIQMEGCHIFKPNEEMDEEFTNVLKRAQKAGVLILAYDSNVFENEIQMGKPIHIDI